MTELADAAMTPERALELVRPYIANAALDVIRRAVALATELNGGALETELAARVALGEGYGWNLYALETAWSPDRIETELRDELLDAIVYRALNCRLQVLAIEALPR